MLWQRRASMVLLLSTVAVLSGCKDATKPQQLVVSSTFDTSDEGWTVSGDAAPASFSATGGNPGGHIFTNDRETGAIWYWNAPSRVVGELRNAYGGTLAFDLKQSGEDNLFNENDVLIRGAGLTLGFNHRTNPGAKWTTLRVQLHERAGWTDISTNRGATKEQLQAALAGATEMRIRGEFRSGSDTGSLDNVLISK